MAKTRRKTAIIFDAINLEGSLIAPAMLERIAARAAGEQSESDYSIPKGLTLRDEIARYYRIGQAHYKDFNSAQSQSLVAPIKLIERLFSDVFGFQAMEKVGTRSLGERVFAITLEGLSGRVPVVVTASSDALDRVSEFLQPDGRKRSAASAVQDWLNASEDSLWGFCSNGQKLRLVRDNASLTRPAYIEADLKQIFENDNFADFTTLWLLIHASRFGAEGKPVSDCALERWRETGSKEGVAARDRLRDGVEAALLSLGNGFLSHENNTGLRDSLTKGELPLPVFFNQLLRLVYRLIFLLAAEDRNVLHPPSATLQSRTLYAEGYSLDLLRKHSIRRAAWDRYHDRWEGLSIVFDALAQGEALLGLPALGGLFGKDQVADLQNAVIANRALLEAVYRLAWLKDDNRLTIILRKEVELEEIKGVLTAHRENYSSVIASLSERFDTIMRELIPSNIKGEIKLDGKGMNLKVMLGGERSTAAIDSLKVVAFDIATLTLTIEGKTYLPSFLLHDSPREADLGGSIYQRLFALMKKMEGVGESPMFQYIVTTTTEPPTDCQSEPWLRLQINGSPASERLMKVDL